MRFLSMLDRRRIARSAHQISLSVRPVRSWRRHVDRRPHPRRRAEARWRPALRRRRLGCALTPSRAAFQRSPPASPTSSSTTPPLQLLPAIRTAAQRDHTCRGRPDAPVRPFDHARAEAALEDGGELAVGEPPATTRILCALYHHDPAATLATFSLLPDVMHLTALADPTQCAISNWSCWLRSSATPAPVPAVLDHVVNILLIQLLRTWTEDSDMSERPPSWLSGGWPTRSPAPHWPHSTRIRPSHGTVNTLALRSACPGPC